MSTHGPFTTPGGVVTDHDPSGVQWLAGNVTPEPLDGAAEPPISPEQTHRTTAFFVERRGEIASGGDVPTRASRADAQALLDPTCPADAEDWRVFALVPARLADGEQRPKGDAWSDLLCALALAAGRPGSNPTNPLWAEHDALHLCADPYDFTDAECDQLRIWGFVPDGDGGFSSYRYGSA